MNKLSLFLYAADVVSSWGLLTFFIGLGFLLFCGIILAIQVISEEEFSSECPNMWKYWWRSLLIGLTAWAICSFIPEKKTMYAIAASEMGERLTQNEQLQGVAGDLAKAMQAWIKQQLETKK